MQFLYLPEATKSDIIIENENYRYLFRVKRYKKNDKINLRNLKDDYLYTYKITNIDKKNAQIELIDKTKKRVEPKKEFHLIWCIVDPKIIEKTIPLLNEIGVKKITFVYCDRSQRNFKIKLDKFIKIAINSSQQCGRSSIIEFEIQNNLNEVFNIYNEICIIDFNYDKIKSKTEIKRALIGCEGGFSANEKELMKDKKIFGLDTDMILRSETAAVAISIFSIL